MDLFSVLSLIVRVLSRVPLHSHRPAKWVTQKYNRELLSSTPSAPLQVIVCEWVICGFTLCLGPDRPGELVAVAMG
uniref:Putative secreted peptide n=1 Tax=Anopheles braziliensis TaxID=58242 RepID=A0A2M3ZNQ4_9DIPT